MLQFSRFSSPFHRSGQAMIDIMFHVCACTVRINPPTIRLATREVKTMIRPQLNLCNAMPSPMRNAERERACEGRRWYARTNKV